MAYAKKNWQKKEVAKIPFPTEIKLSDFQMNIKSEWIGRQINMMINAVAGSGKSFVVAMLCHLDPDKSPALYSSFMTSIVSEMVPKLPDHLIVKGAHALGYAAIASAYNCRPNPNIGKYKIKNFIEQNYNYMADKNDPNSWDRVSNAVDLISKIKLSMTDPTDAESIILLCDIYDISIDCIDKFLKDIPAIMAENDRLAKQGIIDFDDMIYMVVKYDLSVPYYNRVFIDECQDFSPLMQAFMEKFVHPIKGKILVVGDPKQSIMGFAGADCNAMTKMKELFNCVELPLSVCYRCHRGAIEEAQKIVPYIMPHDNSIQGETKFYNASADRFEWSNIHRDSMILCRRNAPLVKPAFKLLKEGIKATIKGQKLGEGLIKLINQLLPKGGTCTELVDAIEVWKEAKIAEILSRKTVNQALIEATEDKADVLVSFCDGVQDSMEVQFKIKRIFDDDSTEGVVLSTAHRSKGLEANNVYILDYQNFEIKRDNMKEDGKQQELNLRYVALTRPKQFLGLLP